ncbi:LysR family transcriptional regulator [Microlunatus speluncae]|uniref:LysR family transcriptional regulator n=1 Tax=Microlunatus speluncae TaxID=2594267 RepID=UPI001376092B|nr:LysR family transcriptional regulator [Microlunatus speluncae]
MPRDLDVRLLRHFVAVADELHFSRAAARLYVAQQTLSRDIRALEDRLGTRLLERNSRSVSLTAAGERLLRHARRLIDDHDELIRAMRVDSGGFVVDIVGEQTTPARVLTEARRQEDGFEYYARTGTGLREAVAQLRAGALDVAFGHWSATAGPSAGLRRRLVRHEPLALLLPLTDPLADSPVIEPAALAELTVCVRAGRHVTADWEIVAQQLLTGWGARSAVDHPYVRGADEVDHHVRAGEPPVLVPISQPATATSVVRPLVNPVPVLSWSMVWLDERDHPALDVLHAVIDRLQDTEHWDALPSPDQPPQ